MKVMLSKLRKVYKEKQFYDLAICNILQKCDASVHVIKLLACKIKNSPFLVGTFHCLLLTFLRGHPCFGLQAITVAFKRGPTAPEKVVCKSFELSIFLFTIIAILYSLHPTKEQIHSGLCNGKRPQPNVANEYGKINAFRVKL